MHRFYLRALPATAVLAVALLIPSLTWAQAESTPKSAPATQPLVATIGDFQAMIDAAGAFGAQIDPSANAATLRESGAQFGDPGFKAFAKGAGIAVVVEDLDRILVALEVTGEARQKYSGMLTRFGMTELSPPEAEGPLLGATAPDMIDGAAKAAAIKALAAANRGRVELELDMVTVAKKYIPRLELMAGSIPSFYGSLAPEMASMARLLEGEARLMLNVLEQVKTMSLSLDIDAKGFMLDGVMRPVAGTRLAKVIAGCEGAADMSLLNRLSSAGGVRGVMTAPQDIVTQFAIDELSAVLTDMNVDAEVGDSLRQLAGMTAGMAGNGFALSMYGGGDASLMDGSFVLQVDSVEKTLDMYEAYSRAMTDGVIDDMYSALGQKWKSTFERNVRKIGDTPVHRMTMSLEVTDESMLDETSQAVFEGLTNLTIEFAPCPGGMVGVFGKTSVEKVLQGLAKPTAVAPLQAVSAHGAGGFMYFDMDMAAVIMSVLGSIPGAEGLGAAIKAGVGHPVTLAAFSKNGEFRGAFRYPAASIAAMAQVAGVSGGGSTGLDVELVMMDLTFACDRFESDHDRWPTSYDELTGKAPNGKTYLETLPVDPWTQKPFLVEWDAKEYGPVFISLGADMKKGGTGVDRDIRSDDED